MAVILDSPIVRERWFRLYRLREHWPPSDKAELRRMCEEAVRTHPIRRLPTVHQFRSLNPDTIRHLADVLYVRRPK
jgi:hypothetical protein